MMDTATLVFMLAALGVAASWLLPARYALDALALWTAAVLAVLAPVSALWLIAVSVLTPLALRAGDRTGRRDLVAGLWAAALLAAFVAARLKPGVGWIGGAFFTLRALHVVGDWWLGRLATPTLRAHLRYQLFLPVIVSGPIHRFETFERQSERRRWDGAQFLSGMERTLAGAFSAAIVGSWLVPRLGNVGQRLTHGAVGFVQAWTQSIFDWINLYFVFAGFTSVALGLSLMGGLRLEENFDRPWAARNLIEFWLRWHMSLTRWCRDYVFRPVTAFSRSALAGLLAAMLAVGLWHAFSVYYILWSFWQAGGVVLTRLALRWLPFDRLPLGVRAVGGPLIVLGWLSLARPVLTWMMGASL